MAIGVTVGLLALLGVSFGALALNGKSVAANGSDHETSSILNDAILYRELNEMNDKDYESTVPPISSSEASRPASGGGGNNKYVWNKSVIASLLGFGTGSAVTANAVGKQPFKWGALIGLFLGGYVAYKVLSK